MKKVWILLCCAGVAFGCNSNKNHKKAVTATDHADHHGRDSNISNQANPVVQIMESMMNRMHDATPSGDNDIDFAQMMMEHHKGAVDMSRLLLEKSVNAELKNFAQKVIDDQEKEIKTMQDLVATSPKTKSADTDDFQKALGNSMKVMMSDSTKVYNKIDADYAAQMIPHHQSAVDMAKVYLQMGRHAQLKRLSENIVISQAKEIEWLKAWLKMNAE